MVRSPSLAGPPCVSTVVKALPFSPPFWIAELCLLGDRTLERAVQWGFSEVWNLLLTPHCPSNSFVWPSLFTNSTGFQP